MAKPSSFARLLLATALVVTFHNAGAVRAADLELLGSAWAAGSAGLLKVRATDHTLLLEVPSAGNVSTVAIDRARRIVWAYAQPNLYSYDFAGSRLTATTIPGTGAEFELVVRPADGSAWLSVDSQLHNVTVGGQLVRSVAGPGIVKELVVDGASAVVWAATASKVTAHDAITGAQIGSVTDLGSKPKVQDISMVGADLWVALSGSLRWYKTAGATTTFQAQKSMSGVLLIDQAATTSGGVLWVVKSNDLVVLDFNFTGLILSTGSLGNPFAAGETPVAIGAVSSSLWIATTASRLVDADGTPVYLPITPPVTLRDVAVFPRETARPSIAFSTASALTNNPFLPVSLTYSDSGSGVDTSSLVVSGGSSGAVAFGCATAAASATCTPTGRYPEGLTTVQGTIKDLAGNSAIEASMTVRLDTQPPSMAITSPADGTVLTNPNPTIAVTYSDTNGVRTQSFRMAAGDPAISFTCNVTSSSASCTVQGGLPAGTHTITATIEDGAANAGSTAVTVTLPGNDTTPPVLGFAAPRASAAVADTTPLLRLSYSDVGMGIDYASLAFTQGGEPLAVSCMYDTTNAGCVPTTPLPLGPVTVTATIRDLAGNVSSAATASFAVVEPRTDVHGVVRRADGTPAAGATVFVPGRAGASVVAAADGSFVISALPARSGERLTVAARLAVGSDLLAGGVTTAPVLGATTEVGAIALQPLCDFGFEDAFGPGNDVSGLAEAFAVFDDGSGPALYVGGTFQFIAGQNVGYVARWSGTAWSTLGSGINAGVNGEVKALAVFDDGSGPALYVAGAFDLAGGQPASNIARWNGTSWSALGSGISNVVNALEVYDAGSGPALYAAGGFVTAGGVAVNRIARWDGFSWWALGSGISSEVKSLAVFDGGGGASLYAGGSFTTAGGAPANRFARWDGTAWSAPPTPGYPVATMAVHADAAGVPALFLNGGLGVSRWDGTTMTALSGSPIPRELLSFDDGQGAQLYAAGDAPGLLRWDGDVWRGAGGGLDRIVLALGLEAGSDFPLPLIVSGTFTTAGGAPLPGLARWAPQCNPPDREAPGIRVTSPLPGSVTTASSVTIAGDVDEQATVIVDGQSVPLDGQRRFSKGPVALAEGLNAFVVTATDAAGNASRADVRVVRDSVAPTLRFVYPVQGQTLTTSLPRLELAVTDAVGVDARTLTVTAGAATLLLSCNAGAELLQCTLAAPLSSGSVTLAARVRDLAGNLSANTQITVTVSPTAASGTTSIAGSVGLVGSAPLGGAQVFVQGQPAALAVSASDGAFTIAGVLATAGQPLTVIARQTSGGATLVGYATAAAPVLGGSTNVGRITLRPVCAASFDQSFVAGYGVDGDYPWKYPNFHDTGFAPQVRALAVYDDGSGPALYVGGTFKQAGGIPANFIAKFDGVRWSALGSAVRGGGTDDYVQALAVYDDGSGAKLYAGGYFTAIDGQSIAHVAKWNGTSWSAVGGGIAGSAVMTLAVWNNALYAAGQFSTAGTVPVRNVARWNGSSWSALGNGLGTSSNMVYALVEHKRLSGSGTALWAGGDFTSSGTAAMKRVAVWDGSSWTEAGGGVGTATDDYSGFFNVSSLGVYKSELYAGGWFQGAGANGSVPATGVARWDGRKWNAVGNIAVTGFLIQEPAGVQALSAFNDGGADALYALGLVDLAGLTPRRDALRWNGSGWSGNGNGPAGSSYGGAALRTWDDPTDGASAKLFAGSGMRSFVNSGLEAKGLATWDGVAWRSVGAGLGYDTRALAVFDNGSGASLYTAGNGVKRMGRGAPPTGKAPSWTELPSLYGGNVLDDAINVLAVLDAGNGPALYAAGQFITPGPWSATSVARWDGGSWVPLGRSFAQTYTSTAPVIRALATFEGPAGRVLVAGGSIGTIDGVAFGNLAQWDGASWQPAGNGVFENADVHALVQHDDGSGRALYAAGDFRFMGGEPAGGIARWDGLRWSAVGRDVARRYRSLAVFDDGSGPRLFAAASLSLESELYAQQVLRWDGSAWAAVGATFDGAIEKLVVADDGAGPALYAVGAFVKAGATTVNRVARWDGTAWVPAGSDLGSGTVRDLVAFDDGTGPALFAAGKFAYGSYGKKSDYGYLSAAGEVYYLAKLRRPLVCSAPDATPPALTITSPAQGAILDTLTPTITLAYSDAGSGVDTASLVLTANGSPLAATCSYGITSATCAPTVPLAEGQVDLAATIRDAAGNVSAAATVSFRISIGAPFVTIVSPADDAVLASNMPRLTINYSSASIPSTLEPRITTSPATVSIECTAEGTQALCDPTPPYADGLTVISVTIRNGAGQLSEPAVVHFTVDTLAPTVGFTAPAAGATVRTGRPQLRLALADAGAGVDTATFEVREGGQLVALSCAFDTTGATCVPVAALADGAHTLSATVRDHSGKTSTPAALAFTVDTSDTTQPSIVVTTPLLTNQASSVVGGSVSEEATVAVNGALATVAGDLTFSFGPVSLAEGSNAFHLVATDLTGNVGTHDVSVVLDTARPALGFVTPAPENLCSPTGQALEVSWSDIGAGIDVASLSFAANGVALAASCQSTSAGATCTAGTLPNGSVDLRATVRDLAGNLSTAASVLCVTDPDLLPPQITVYAPAPNSAVNTPELRILGALSKSAALTIDGQSVVVAADLSFQSGPYTLSAGLNTFSLDAQDGSGNLAHLSLAVTFDASVPEAVRADRVTLTEQAPGEHSLVGAAGAVTVVEPGVAVAVSNLASGGGMELTPAADGSFQATLVAFDGDTVRITVRDAAGNESVPVDLRASGADPIPADPAAVAPPLDPTSSIDACDLVSFFWSGASKVQFGVQPAEIDCNRLAVVRGRVVDPSGAGLVGVRVAALFEPGYGATFTRADGSYDFAVRAQGEVVLAFAKPGFFASRRTLQLLPQQFTTIDDVTLLPPDSQVTPIDVTGGAGLQVARGSVVTDTWGSRRPTLLFPQGTTATLRSPGGGSQTVTSLEIRATEFSQGQGSVPGTLPPELVPSFALELSADAAETAGAGVEFSGAVPVYVENFLDAATGSAVDVLTLDRSTGTWIPEPSGRIVEIVGIDAGLAELDLTGSGSAASPAELLEIGIDEAERAQLATLYPVGQSLSRIAVTHFTAFAAGRFLTSPSQMPTPIVPPPVAGDETKLDFPAITPYAGTIESDNQVLGEALGVTGTPFTLHYRSDRVPGRKAPYRLRVHLTGTQVPAGLTRVELTIDVAGSHHTRTFQTAPNLTHEFLWDRRDGYGREIQGQAQATVTLRYFGNDDSEPGPIERAVGRFTYANPIGTLDAASALGLGGWTLSAHHYYDQPNGTLYYGDGGRRTLSSYANDPRVIERVAGTGAVGSTGDGTDARRARLNRPAGLSVTKDGSLLIADTGACRVRKIDPNGRISTIAGSVCGDANNGQGDGGRATAAVLERPVKAVQTPSGDIYIADQAAHRIRKVDRRGIITTFVGTGVAGCGANQLAHPHDIALASKGGLLIANVGMWDGGTRICDSIQQATPGGLLVTLADRTARSWSIKEPQGVAAGPDGSVYFTPVSALVKRPPGGAEDPQHPGWVVAGWPHYYQQQTGEPPPTVFSGDGQAASQTNTRFFLPDHLAVGLDGTVYLVDRLNQRIRTVSTAEGVDTLVGGGPTIPAGDGIAARGARLADPSGIALDEARHVLYFADAQLSQVWKVRLGARPASSDETVVPELDGSVRHIFDSHGHHLRTEDAISGQVLMRFSNTQYAQSGGRIKHLLTSIEDASGNVSQVERSFDGEATGIVGPFGQRTALQINPLTGYLTQVSHAGQAVEVRHDPDGLLRTLTDPRSGTYSFDYDGEGRLRRAGDPANGSLSLTYTEQPDGWKVDQLTALGRTSRVEVHLPPEDPAVTTPLSPDDLSLRAVTDPAGLRATVRETKDRKEITTLPDGMTSTAQLVPDPLLGDLAPYVQKETVETPSGLRQVVTTTRNSEAVSEGSLDASSRSETVSANGRTSTITYTKSTRTVRYSSPQGRQSTTLLDALGRVVQEQLPGIEAVRTSYDSRGRLARIEQGATRATTYGYDAEGFLASITDPLQRQTSFERDEHGRVTKQVLPDQRQIGFSYDANGNLTSVTPPSRPAHTFVYTAVDRLETYLPPAAPGAGTTSYAYNNDRQLELVTRPDGQTIDPAYDTAGRLESVATPLGATTYSYHSATGHLGSVTAPAGGGTTTYGYDGSLLTQIGQSGPVSGTVSYAYDRAGDGASNFWIASRTVNGDAAGSVAYQYDSDGLLTAAGPLQLQRAAANGLIMGTTLLQTTETVERNDFGDVTHFRSTFGGGCTPPASCAVVLDQTYTRDIGGRISSLTETLSDPLSITSETHTNVYTFDTAGRLTQVQRDGVVWETYGYDGNSNRTSWTDPWGAGSATYDDQDRLLTYGTKSYTYTANGELASKSEGAHTVRYTYDVAGNLRRVELPGGTAIDYVIDAANRRIAKKVNGVQVRGFLYGIGGAPLAELDGGGAVAATFIYASKGNVPDVMLRGGNTYRIVTDHLGSVRWVLDAETGQVLQRMDYDAFGRVTFDSNPGFQPFGFAGGLYDYQTGLVRFGARDYDAETGRWTSKDPIGFAGGDTNLYGYVVNDPVNFKDSSGLIVETAWDAANVVMDVASLATNVAAGNIGGAIVDAVGLVVDAVATAVPGVPGGMGVAIDAARAADRVADGAAAAKTVEHARGWKAGESIRNLTARGDTPAWSTVRQRIWKNEARSASSEGYNASNLARMRRGLAPQRINPRTGSLESMELHHMPTRRQGGLFDVQKLWPDDHALVDPFRRTGNP